MLYCVFDIVNDSELFMYVLTHWFKDSSISFNGSEVVLGSEVKTVRNGTLSVTKKKWFIIKTGQNLQTCLFLVSYTRKNTPYSTQNFRLFPVPCLGKTLPPPPFKVG